MALKYALILLKLELGPGPHIQIAHVDLSICHSTLYPRARYRAYVPSHEVNRYQKA